ncbi:MAG: hypothetical protein KGZ54_07060 [Dethiobacter sp.]|nr:hypothetical protein [Dethiobacter sp.]MBS3901763.1 hypothetical protein [Dethiobacter sp.]
MEGVISCVVVSLLVLFLVLVYVFIVLSQAKKSGFTREDLLIKTTAWLVLKKRAAREYILTKEGNALVSVLASLLAYFWITGQVGFRPPSVSARLFNPLHYMTLHLIFLVPASLGLALKKIAGVLIAIPYLILLGLGLLGVMILGGDSFREAVMFDRANITFIIACAVPVALVALLWKISEEKKRRIYLAALVFHLVILAGAVYYYAYHYGVWHLAGEPVSVQRLRLGDGDLSFPLIEEDAAYIVDRQGRLYQVELMAGRKRILASIPRPTAAEAGFPELVLPYIERPGSPFKGVLTRVNNSELSFRYIYHLMRRIEYGYGDGGSWTMEVRINLESGQVSWQLEGKEHGAPVEFPPSVYTTEAQGKIIRVVPDHGMTAPFSVLIEGEALKTAIDPMGWMNWAQAKYGWILVGTNRGGLLIVTLNR